MARIEPFKRNDKEPHQNWYLKTAIKGMAIIGTGVGFYGMYKFRGPAFKLIQAHFKKEFDKFAQQEYKKETGQNTPILQSKDSLKGHTITVEATKAELDSPLRPSTFTTNNINRMEIEMSMKGKVGDQSQIDNTLLHKLNPEEAKDLNLLFKPLRYDTIKEFISIHGAKNIGEFEDIESWGDASTTKIEAVSAIHNYYVENDLEYADLYQKRIAKLYRVYASRYKAANVTTKEFRDRLFALKVRSTQGDGIVNHILARRESFMEDASSKDSNNRVKDIYGKVPSAKEIRFFAASEQEDLMKQLKSWDGKSELYTSRSGFREFKSDVLKRKLNYKYTRDLRGIVDLLTEIRESKDASGENLYGVSDVNFTMETYGKGPNMTRKAIISIKHNNKNTYSFELPIALDGFLPGSLLNARKIMDQEVIIDSNYFAYDNIKTNNSTQAMAAMIRKSLQTRVFSGEFKDHPEKFINQITYNLSIFQRMFPKYTGQVRDMIKMAGIWDPLLVSLTHPNPKNSKYLLNKTRNGLNSLRTFKAALRDPNAMVLTIDLETLSLTNAGPTHSVQDISTQVYGAGFSLSDIHKNGKVIDAFELMSEHPIEVLDKYVKDGILGYTDPAINWMKQITGEKDPDRAIGAFKDMLHKNKTGEYHSNDDFLREVLNVINKTKQSLDRNKRLYVVVKNGNDFDLRFLKTIMSPEAQRSLDECVIDVHDIQWVMQRTTGSESSLSIEEVLKTILGRITGESVDLNTMNQDRILKILSSKRKGKFLENSQLSQLLDLSHLSDKKRAKLFTGKMHVSPTVDTLITTAIFRYLHTLSEEGNEFFSDPVQERLERYLKYSGQKTIQDELDIGRSLEGRNIPGVGFVTMSAATQGMRSKLRYSLFGQNSLTPVPGDPLQKQWDHLHRGVWVGPSSWWRKELKKQKRTGDKSTYVHNWERRRMFTPSMITDALMDFEDIVTRSVDANKNYYSHQVVANTIYLWNPWMGSEGLNVASQEFLNKIHIGKTIEDTILLEQGELTSNPEINDKLLLFRKRIETTAAELSRDSGKNGVFTTEIWEQACTKVSNQVDVMSSLNETFAKTDLGIIQNKSRMRGRFTGFYVEPSSVNSRLVDKPRIYAKIQRFAEGAEIMEHPVMATLYGSRAMLSKNKVLSQAMATLGVDMMSNADFLEKGHFAVLKMALLNKAIRKNFDVIYERHSTSDKISKARENLKKIASAINGTISDDNGKIIINTGNKGIKPFANLKSESDIDLFYRSYGNVDVSFKEIMKFQEDAGYIYEKKQAELYNNIVFGKERSEKSLRQTFKQYYEKIYKQWEAKEGAFKFLDKKGINQLGVDLTSFVEFLTAKEGRGILMEAFNVGTTDKPFYMTGINATAEQVAFSGIDEGTHSRTSHSLLRNDYLMQVMHSEDKFGKYTKEFLKDNVLFKRFVKYKSAKKTYENFRDTLLSNNIAEGKSLTREDLDFLIDRPGRLAMAAEKNTLLTDNDLKAANERLMELVQYTELAKDPNARKAMEEKIAVISQELLANKGKLLKSLVGNRRWYSSKEVQEITDRFQKYDGVLSLDLTLKGKFSTFDLPIDQLIKTAGNFSPGLKNKNENEIKVLSNKIFDLFHQIHEEKQQDSIFSVEERVGSDGKPDRVIHMKNFVMSADPYRSNSFNRISNDFLLSNSETNLREEVLLAYRHYANMLTKTDHHVESYQVAKNILQRKMFQYLTTAIKSDKTSTSWLAEQFAPSGLTVKHKNVESIIQSALLLKQNGFSGFEPKAREDATRVVNSITNSTLDTLFIHEDTFNRMTTTINGEVKNLRQHLESIAEKGFKFEDLISGKTTLPGGVFTRFPVLGENSIGLYRMGVVKSNVADYLGIDKNSFYAHTIFTKLMKFDSDSDETCLLNKAMGVVASADELNKEHGKALNALMQNPYFKNQIETMNNEIEKGKNGEVVKLGKNIKIIGNSGGMTTLGYWGRDGKAKTIQVPSEKVDYGANFEQIADLVCRMSSSSPQVITPEHLQTRLNEPLYAMASKNQIPIATNLAKKRVKDVLMRAKTLSARETADIIGDLNHGIIGSVTQPAIALSKHVGDVAELDNIMSFWKDPSKKELEDVVRKNFVGAITTDYSGTPEGGIENYANHLFDIITGASIDADKANRMSNKIRQRSKSLEDITFGRRDASQLDRMLNDFGTVAYSEVADELTGGYVPRNDNSFNQFIDNVKTRFKLNDFETITHGKLGKYGAIGAGIFLAANLFRPHQLSSSTNPLDAFVDLGTDQQGNTNAFSTDVELERRLPLDMVNASFSKEAFVRLGHDNAKEKSGKANIINKLLKNSFMTDTTMYDFRQRPGISYINKTSTIPYFGSGNLSRRHGLY